jgi:hypothetical protein
MNFIVVFDISELFQPHSYTFITEKCAFLTSKYTVTGISNMCPTVPDKKTCSHA